MSDKKAQTTLHRYWDSEKQEWMYPEITNEELLREALEHAVFFLERVRNGDIDPKASSFNDCLVQAKAILEKADPVTVQEMVINNLGSPT